MDHEQRKQLGERIKEARLLKGWSQRQLGREAARQLGKDGGEVSENTIADLERATRKTQDGTIRAVLAALGIAEPTGIETGVLSLDGLSRPARLFLTYAAQRMRVCDDSELAQMLNDFWPLIIPPISDQE